MQSLVILGLSALSGCSEPIEIAVRPDAGEAPSPDAGPAPAEAPHCEIDPSAREWTVHENPVSVRDVLDRPTGAIAMHDGRILAGRAAGALSITEGDHWTDFPSVGLDPMRAIDTLGFALGTWWVGQEGSIYRWSEDGSSWRSAGEVRPREGERHIEIHQFLAVESALFALTSNGLWSLGPSGDAWAPIADDMVDAAATDEYVYVLHGFDWDTLEQPISRTRDGVAWEPMGSVPVQCHDLAAGARFVALAAERGGLLSGGHYRLDERDPSLTWRPFDASESPQPSWIGPDGTTIGWIDVWERSLGVAPAIDGPFGPLETSVRVEETGVAFVWQIAAEHTTIASLGDDARIRRSDDHGRSWRIATSELRGGPIEDLATDGTLLILRVATEDGSTASFRAESGGWSPIELPGDGVPSGPTTVIADPDFDHIESFDGALVGLHVAGINRGPFVSVDGASSFERLEAGYPSFASSTGTVWRTAVTAAFDAEGTLHVGTIGGFVQLPGKVVGDRPFFGYRPGAGVLSWRSGGGSWQPSNAGVPIVAPADNLGASGPYRADVRSMIDSDVGLLAYFDGYGVHRRVGVRWQPYALGLPIDVRPRLFRVGASAIAVADTGVWALEDGLWVPRGISGVTAVATRADLFVHGSVSSVQASPDGGETNVPLPALAGVVDLELTRARLYARTAEHRIYSLPIVCTEAP